MTTPCDNIAFVMRAEHRLLLVELDFLLMPGGRLLRKKRAAARLDAALDRAEAAA